MEADTPSPARLCLIHRCEHSNMSRIIHGSRISLSVGIAAAGISLLIGVTLGLLSGFLGGRVDVLIMALVDIMLAFPQLILAFAMVAVLGPGIGNIILVLDLTWLR